ncbi:MAG: Gfo/Idh/MocA family protein, partial [Gammaproteobacteria bacterium]
LQIDLVKAAGPYKPGTQMVEVGTYQRYVDDFIELAAAIRGEKKLTASLEHELLLHEILLRASQM